MDPLCNPIWHALVSRHARIATGTGGTRRYPPAYAPFLAVEDRSISHDELDKVVQPGERVGILGVIPSLGWNLEKDLVLRQYLWSGREIAQADIEAALLGEEDIPAMLELTALVYPAYFRPETARLGDYFGIYHEGRLAAMAGTRFSFPGFREISAICTHPEFRSQGLAGRLTRHLVKYIQDLGEQAFLHTESDNPAQGMYEKLGFELHQMIPFQVWQRPN